MRRWWALVAVALSVGVTGAWSEVRAEEIDPQWIVGTWVTDRMSRGATEQWELVFDTGGTFRGSIAGARTLTMAGAWKIEGDAVRLEGHRTSGGSRSRRGATVGEPFNDRFRREGDILKREALSLKKAE